MSRPGHLAPLLTSLLALASPGPSEAAPRPAPPAVAAAEGWLLGLRATSAARMERVAGFPLRIAAANGKGPCDATVEVIGKLPATLRCLKTRERLLVLGLQHPDAPGAFEVVTPAGLGSPELRALAERARAGGPVVLVRAEVNGVGASYELLFVVDPRGPVALVRAFHYDATLAA